MTLSPRQHRSLRVLAIIATYLLAIWIFGFIWFAGPFPNGSLLNPLTAILWLAAVIFLSRRLPRGKQRRIVIFLLLLIPLAAWSLMRPSHQRKWGAPFEKISHAQISGDTITIRNYRSFDYTPDGRLLPNWTTRTFNLKNLRSMDFFMTRWGSGYTGHPIFSFDFGEQGHCAFTIEAKLERFETYSIPAGLFRRYELTYAACDESDAIRLRTNFRENEQVYLYRTIATPEQARARFLEFVSSMNDIHAEPRFYNIIFSNCTTAIRSQTDGEFPWDWRVFVNGTLDELLYERGMLETAGLTFPELHKRALINPKVSEHPGKEGYSERIRTGTPGF